MAKPAPQIDLTSRFEVMENVRLQTVTIPRFKKVCAAIYMPVGPLLLIAMFFALWYEQKSLNIFANSVLWKIFLLGAIVAFATIALGVWVLKRSKQQVQYIKDNYTFSYALTPEGVHFPESYSGQKFVAWSNLIRLRTQVPYSKYRGAPGNFHVEFHCSNGTEQHIFGAPIAYIMPNHMKHTIAYFKAYAPASSILDEKMTVSI